MKVFKIFIGMAVIILLAVILCVSAWFYCYTDRPLNPDLGTITVTIPRGAAFVHIAKMLEEEGLLRNRKAFYLLARMHNIHDRMRAGEYELAGTATPRELLDKLSRGDVKVYHVAIPEGFSMYQVADRFAAQGLVDRDTFRELLFDRDLLSALHIDGLTAEGYLFPDTYHVTRAKDEEAIIRFMVRRFREEVSPAMVQQAEQLGLSLHELVTLASLIEKEARVEDEKPLISAVFSNRLKRGMRLQSDPTVIYGVDDFEGRIRRKDLVRETPYNTYRISGLPPGPICNPGIASITAALEPAAVNYLYFVSKNDGTHHFSSNLSDHNQAVIKYQIKRQK